MVVEILDSHSTFVAIIIVQHYKLETISIQLSSSTESKYPKYSSNAGAFVLNVFDKFIFIQEKSCSIGRYFRRYVPQFDFVKEEQHHDRLSDFGFCFFPRIFTTEWRRTMECQKLGKICVHNFAMTNDRRPSVHHFNGRSDGRQSLVRTEVWTPY